MDTVRKFTRTIEFQMPSTYPPMERHPDLRVPLHFERKYTVQYNPPVNSQMSRAINSCKEEANRNIGTWANYTGLHYCPNNAASRRQDEPFFHVIGLLPNGVLSWEIIGQIVKKVVAIYALDHFPIRFFLHQEDAKGSTTLFDEERAIAKVMALMKDMLSTLDTEEAEIQQLFKRRTEERTRYLESNVKVTS